MNRHTAFLRRQRIQLTLDEIAGHGVLIDIEARSTFKAKLEAEAALLEDAFYAADCLQRNVANMYDALLNALSRK